MSTRSAKSQTDAAGVRILPAKIHGRSPVVIIEGSGQGPLKVRWLPHGASRPVAIAVAGDMPIADCVRQVTLDLAAEPDWAIIVGNGAQLAKAVDRSWPAFAFPDHGGGGDYTTGNGPAGPRGRLNMATIELTPAGVPQPLEIWAEVDAGTPGIAQLGYYLEATVGLELDLVGPAGYTAHPSPVERDVPRAAALRGRLYVASPDGTMFEGATASGSVTASEHVTVNVSHPGTADASGSWLGALKLTIFGQVVVLPTGAAVRLPSETVLVDVRRASN